MAIQALLDPSPLQLIATTSPSPRHVNWRFTYITRKSRYLRSWLVTLVILMLTVVWSLLLVPIASVVDLENIRAVLPSLAELIEKHDFLKSLVQTQLPTGLIALLNLLVPVLYSRKPCLHTLCIRLLTMLQNSRSIKASYPRVTLSYRSSPKTSSLHTSTSSSSSPPWEPLPYLLTIGATSQSGRLLNSWLSQFRILDDSTSTTSFFKPP
jgi:hypothetical protein